MNLHQTLVMEAIFWPHYIYRSFCNWLELPTCRYKQHSIIHTPLIKEIYSCLPQADLTSNHFSQLAQWMDHILVDLTWLEQKEIYEELIGPNQATRERLITGFANSVTRLSLPFTLARVNSNSTNSELLTDPPKMKSHRSPLHMDTQLDRRSKLSLLVARIKK